MRDSRTIHLFSTAAVLGAAVGALVIADPYLANALAGMVDLSLLGTNIFKLFDFEITAAIFVLLILLLLLIRVLSRRYSIGKVFVILYLVGVHTAALTNISRIDFSELALLFFAVLFLIRSLRPGSTVMLTAFDLLNLLLITILVLPAVNTNIVMLADSLVTGTKMILITFLTVNYLRDRELVRFAIRWFIIITFLSACIALFQTVLYVATGYPLIGFVDHRQLKFMFEETSFGVMLRVPAFFGTYKPFTFFLNTAILLLLNCLLYRSLTFKQKLLASLASSVMLSAVILTFSKDALLSLSLAVALSVLLWRPQFLLHWSALVLLVLVLGVAFGLVDDVWDAINADITWQEERIRLILAKEGISGFIHRHPWIGIGVRATPRYTAHFYRWPAHNSFIQAADAGGLVGLIVYCALIGYTFKCLVKLILKTKNDPERWISMGMFNGFITFVIANQFHPFFLERFLWLFMGLVKAMELSFVDRAQTSPQRG